MRNASKKIMSSISGNHRVNNCRGKTKIALSNGNAIDIGTKALQQQQHQQQQQPVKKKPHRARGSRGGANRRGKRQAARLAAAAAAVTTEGNVVENELVTTAQKNTPEEEVSQENVRPLNSGSGLNVVPLEVASQDKIVPNRSNQMKCYPTTSVGHQEHQLRMPSQQQQWMPPQQFHHPRQQQQLLSRTHAHPHPVILRRQASHEEESYTQPSRRLPQVSPTYSLTSTSCSSSSGGSSTISTMQVKQRTYSDDTIKEEDGTGVFGYFSDQQQQQQLRQRSDQSGNVENRNSNVPAPRLQTSSDALPTQSQFHSHHQYNNFHQGARNSHMVRQTNYCHGQRQGPFNFAGAPPAPSYQWEENHPNFHQACEQHPAIQPSQRSSNQRELKPLPALPPMQRAKDQTVSYLDRMNSGTSVLGMVSDAVHSNSYLHPLGNGKTTSGSAQVTALQSHHQYNHHHGGVNSGGTANNPYALKATHLPSQGHDLRGHNLRSTSMSNRASSPNTNSDVLDVETATLTATASNLLESETCKKHLLTSHATNTSEKQSTAAHTSDLYVDTKVETTGGEETAAVSDPFAEAARRGIGNSNLSRADAEQIQRQCEALSCGGSMFNTSPRSFLMGRFKKARTVSHDTEWN